MNITEEQKKIIESHGHMVIEFKMWVRKTASAIKDTWRLLYEYFLHWVVDDFSPRMSCLIREATEALKKTAELVKKYIKSANWYTKTPRTYHPKEKHVKPISMCCCQIWHRARSNC